jgi:formamidopyrimidine-DNA glycosylase
MPEGPEVRITADGLNRLMQGDYIYEIVVNSKSRYNREGIKNHYDVSYPMYVSEVESRGKKILIKGIDDSGQDIVIISALGMEGKWRNYTGKHAGIELHMSSGSVMYFHDTRHFGTFDICLTSDEYDFVMKHVGPDLMKDDITYDDYHSVITRKRIGGKDIYCFLMDQSYFSGIGNYLAAEVMYASQVLPDRKLNSLSDDEIYSLYQNSLNLINESYSSNGLTISTYFDLDNNPGTFECRCYGRKYDPEGRRIVKKNFSNGRTAWYCPDYQF